MTKTYELPNEKMIMADIDEKHHTATVSVYALDNLVESVNRTGHWIPVSERLPEAGKQYLCCNEEGFREVGYLSKVTGEWGFTDTEAFGEVIAWMPLPEPYTGESEGEE